LLRRKSLGKKLENAKYITSLHIFKEDISDICFNKSITWNEVADNYKTLIEHAGAGRLLVLSVDGVITDEVFKWTIGKLCSLQELVLTSTFHMSHKSWEHFKVLSHLKKLSLKGSRVQDADIKLICLIPNLEELHLFGCFKVSDKCFDYICGFSLLKKLSVTHNATISIESAMQVQRLRGLVSLNVEDTFK